MTRAVATTPVTGITKDVIVANDTLRTIGRPFKDGNKLRGLILVGDKFTYLVSSGSKEIEEIVDNLDLQQIKMEPETRLRQTDKNFRGELHFVYIIPENNIPLKQSTTLKKLCSQRVQNLISSAPEIPFSFECKVTIAGSLYTPQESILKEMVTLKEGHNIVLIASKTERNLSNLEATQSKLDALPAAVLIDTVTAPLQILFFAGEKLK